MTVDLSPVKTECPLPGFTPNGPAPVGHQSVLDGRGTGHD